MSTNKVAFDSSAEENDSNKDSDSEDDVHTLLAHATQQEIMPDSRWEDDDGESHAYMTTFGALNTETNTVGLKGTDNISTQDKAEVMSASSQISSITPDANSQVMYRVIFSQHPKTPLNGGYCVVRQGSTTLNKVPLRVPNPKSSG